jgi:transcriptional regulator NrdR family protein
MTIKITKRDNSTAVYDPEKITRVVKEAGLTKKEAMKLTSSITKWLKKQARAQVTSLQIRDRVIIEIQKRNVAAAKKFIWYEKYKDKHYGEEY